jgi:hypothetical protein
VLSAEKCPSICGTLYAYEGLLKELNKYQHEQGIELYDILENGIAKLEEYKQETDNVPAYTLAICEYLLFFIILFSKI